LTDNFVTKSEFGIYCKSVNGDLADIKADVSNLAVKMDIRFKESLEHFDSILTTESDRRRVDTKEAICNARADTAEALRVAQESVKDAVHGTVNKSYAIIITVLTALLMGVTGAFLTLLITHSK